MPPYQMRRRRQPGFSNPNTAVAESPPWSPVRQTGVQTPPIFQMPAVPKPMAPKPMFPQTAGPEPFPPPMSEHQSPPWSPVSQGGSGAFGVSPLVRDAVAAQTGANGIPNDFIRTLPAQQQTSLQQLLSQGVPFERAYRLTMVGR